MDEDLKAMWSAYDQRLERSLKLNEQLLRKLNLDKMRREMNKPLVSELITIGFTFIFVLYLVIVSLLVIEAWPFSIPGLVAAASGVGLILFALNRVKGFRRMNYVEDTTLKLQQDLFKVARTAHRWSRIELALGILSATAMWPLVLYTGFEIDVYQNLGALGIALGICAILAVPVVIAHTKFYRKKLGNAQQLLSELKDLETEG